MGETFDTAIIGGGLIGAAIGYGMARRGLRVALLDEGDVARRAARGNFGLVWVQSKGLGMPDYSLWTRRSADLWPAFADELRAVAEIDVAHRRPGGFTLCLSEMELERRKAMLARLHGQPGMVGYPYEFVGRAQLVAVYGEIGPDVAGASYCPLDGHVNPLRLFRALHTAFARLSGRYLPEHAVTRIVPSDGRFIIETPAAVVEAGRVVLTAGVGNARLAPMVGLRGPVRPQRGQMIVTEKTAPFLSHPVVTVRQTDEGGVMIGDSQEEVTEDREVRLGILSVEASRAIRMFPRIGRLNVVRTWSALRVMTPDGFPIYDQSEAAPGAFLCTCHSGVTLAAAHAVDLAPMLAGGALGPALRAFSARRLDVPKAS